MYNLTEEQIHRVLTNYKKKKKRESDYYHNSQKHNEKFMEKNRERARNHYENNKHVKQHAYKNDTEFYKARSLMNYYKKRGTFHVFEEKHPEKVKLLKDRRILP
tara:strand:- start:29 stop:340 length:312 start_codon:yes stop_codon:yes gene_type:complete